MPETDDERDARLDLVDALNRWKPVAGPDGMRFVSDVARAVEALIDAKLGGGLVRRCPPEPPDPDEKPPI